MMESQRILKDSNTKHKQAGVIQASRKGVLPVVVRHFIMMKEHINKENSTVLLNVQQL